MTREAEVAWAAAIIEGEGWIGKAGNSARLTVAMVDRDVVETLAQILNLHPPTPRRAPLHRPNRQIQWEVRTSGEKAMDTLRRVRPYMHARRRAKIDEVEAAMAQKYDARACVWCGCSYDPKPKAPLGQRFCTPSCQEAAKAARKRLARQNASSGQVELS